MVDTTVDRLMEATRRHQDIQAAIRKHASQLGKTVGPGRQEEGNASDGTNPGQ